MTSLQLVDDAYAQSETPTSSHPEAEEESAWETTGDFVTREVLIERAARISRRPLWGVQIEGRRFRAVRPIELHVFQDGEFFFAESETLNILGTGFSAREAIEDAVHHLIHFWEYYRKLSWNQVTSEAARLKKLFETLFVEE